LGTFEFDNLQSEHFVGERWRETSYANINDLFVRIMKYFSTYFLDLDIYSVERTNVLINYLSAELSNINF